MRPCPQCGCKVLNVGHDVTIWETVTLEITDAEGNWKEIHAELHDQVAAEPFETASCDACGHTFNPLDAPA